MSETNADHELVAELAEALRDMLAGWKYIRSFHGDLYGVGWDRAQGKAEAALAAVAMGPRLTDEQIDALVYESREKEWTTNQFVRAIESAIRPSPPKIITSGPYPMACQKSRYAQSEGRPADLFAPAATQQSQRGWTLTASDNGSVMVDGEPAVQRLARGATMLRAAQEQIDMAFVALTTDVAGSEGRPEKADTGDALDAKRFRALPGRIKGVLGRVMLDDTSGIEQWRAAIDSAMAKGQS